MLYFSFSLQISIYVIAIILIILGLLLSSSGSSGGLAALSGHDLELFKKSKDYGVIKLFKLIMFLLILLLLVLSVLLFKNPG